MKNEIGVFEKLHEEGLIGNELYNLITDEYDEPSTGAIAGAVLLASIEAYENARKTNLPLLIKEGDFLFEIKPDGSKRIVKTFPKNTKHLPKEFTLK